MIGRILEQKINLDTGHVAETAYYQDGTFHRDPSVGPALTHYDEQTGELRLRQFYWKGKLHNPHGPAHETWVPGGLLNARYFYLNGQRHRENAPAIVQLFSGTTEPCYEAWYQKGRLHRDPRHGPALIVRNEVGGRYVKRITHMVQEFEDPFSVAAPRHHFGRSRRQRPRLSAAYGTY